MQGYFYELADFAWSKLEARTPLTQVLSAAKPRHEPGRNTSSSMVRAARAAPEVRADSTAGTETSVQWVCGHATTRAAGAFA